MHAYIQIYCLVYTGNACADTNENQAETIEDKTYSNMSNIRNNNLETPKINYITLGSTFEDE